MICSCSSKLLITAVESIAPFIFSGRGDSKDVVGRQDHRSLDQVFQLAYIAGPRPALKFLDHRFGNRVDVLIHATRVLPREVLDQQRNH